MQIVHPTPLQIAGDTTPEQQESLKDALSEASQRILRSALKHLDRQNIDLLLELEDKLKAEIASAGFKIIERLTISDKFKDEETVSQRGYPPTYRVNPIEAQVTELRKAFPALGGCTEKLGRKPLPEGAEAWFAIPRWDAVAPTYSQAVQAAITALGNKRRLSNRILEKMGPTYLRQNDRTRQAESILAGQQPGSEILVVAAQFGMRHRGCSARRARVALAGNEFGLGSFAIACMLLTHPDRLSRADALMIDCSGDEYSLYGDIVFDRVPLFDFDIGGLEFSIFYENRARNLWGTPTGFTVQVAAAPDLHRLG